MLSSFAYRHSPIWAQESFISAKSSLRSLMREGRTFEAMAAQVHQSQWWTEQQLRDFQSRQLQMIVESSMRDVPYYRDRYRPVHPEFRNVKCPEAMAKLPLITKADLRVGGKSFISERKLGTLFPGSTSGTTGTPLSLYQDLPAINRENAFVRRQLTWAGLRKGDRRAWLRGDMIVPARQQKPPYWRVNRAENMLMLSSYHLSDSAAADYVEALAAFDPVVIQAYPSSIGFLATWMRNAGIRYRGKLLRGIVTSSETLADDRRREIEDAFGCKVFDWYGQFERVAAIGTCEHGRYHLLSDYSYVEMLPAGDGLFELVGTGFNNMSMPLIRYRCGDYVIPAPAKERCACGRAFPLIEHIIGRIEDSIKLPDGRSIGRLDHIFKGVDGILEAQIRQDSPDAVTLLIVPSPTFNNSNRDTLESNTRERLGEEINFEIRLVDAIARTKNGKFKGVVCNV